MIAYVFWHGKQASIAAEAYEQRQRAFHAALASAPPAGFLRSWSGALAGAPWASAGGAAYEDWYMVEDFAALGTLNDAAVSMSRQGPHDAAAAVAASGAGGVYRLHLGRAAAAPQHATWFSKPTGMTYQALYQYLAPVIARMEGQLWLRQMVLGPAPELCIHTASPVPLPAAFDTLTIPLRSVWP